MNEQRGFFAIGDIWETTDAILFFHEQDRKQVVISAQTKFLITAYRSHLAILCVWGQYYAWDLTGLLKYHMLRVIRRVDSGTPVAI